MKINPKILVLTATVLSSSMFGMVSSPAPWNGEGDVNYNVSAHTGIMQGKAQEYVYMSIPVINYFGTNSRLDWKFKDVFVGGVEGGVRWGRLTLNGGIWTALNEGGGTLKDYDWVDIKEFAYAMGFSYSETDSDCELDELMALDLNAGYDFYRSDSIDFMNDILPDFMTQQPVTGWASVFAGLRSESWRWSGFGLTGGCGFPEYGYWVRQYVPGSEKVIEYKQEYLYGYLGVRGGLSFGSVDLNAYIAYAPGFHIKDRDYHVLRDMTFPSDNGYDSHILLYGISASIDLDESLTLALSLDAVKSGIADTEGDAFGREVEDDDEDVGIYSSYGASIRDTMVSLSVSYKF